MINQKCGLNKEKNNYYSPCCSGSTCYCNNGDCKCKLDYKVKVLRDFDCEKTPVRGSDVEPEFDPHNDVGGCFETMQYDNNCYNYGTDILTNTFAQPGRGTQHKWKQNTCEEVKIAAVYDGLKWVGTEVPHGHADKGHYVTLLIWPNTNFHWVRLDSNGKWSHKPGSTPVTNTDNDGNEITDPSTQDFSPWSQYCGIFQVLPSQITID